MTLKHYEYDYVTELGYWSKEESAIFLEKVIEHALIELNAKYESELVHILVEDQHCIARVINDFTPIEISEKVIIFDVESKVFTKKSIKIKHKITFA